MIRSLLAVAVTVLVVSIWACDGSSDEQASSLLVTVTPIPTFPELPTIAAVPTLPAATRSSFDPNVGCGPPLGDPYCTEQYQRPPSSCPVSDVWDLQVFNISYGIGRPPVWMFSAPVTGAQRLTPGSTPEAGFKTIWIVNDGVEGEVKLTGRRLDGPEVAVFPLYERDHTFELDASGERQRDWDRTELVLVPPHGRLKEHRTGVFYPIPGCWQFTARTQNETVEIVQYLYPVEPP